MPRKSTCSFIHPFIPHSGTRGLLYVSQDLAIGLAAMLEDTPGPDVVGISQLLNFVCLNEVGAELEPGRYEDGNDSCCSHSITYSADTLFSGRNQSPRPQKSSSP